MNIYKENWKFVVDILWLLLENNWPKHWAFGMCLIVSHCSLQSDSVVILDSLFSCFLFLPLSWPADYKNTKNTIWENMCWNQKKTFSVSNICRTAALEPDTWSNNQTRCFLAVFEIFISFPFFRDRHVTTIFLTVGNSRTVKTSYQF